jgi:hypothetical protein
MVFDDSATRATAIGTANFSEGMVTYTKDDDAIQVYDGSDFVGVGSDSGLIHIETQALSAVSGISFNNVFSSTYDNYKFILTGVGSLAGTDIQIRLRAGGTDNSTASSYVSQLLRSSSTTVQGVRITDTVWRNFFLHNTLKSAFEFDFYDPFKASATAFSISNVYAETGGRVEIYMGTHNQATSYDGFSLIVAAPAGATMTGSISIYGYKK